MKSLFCFAVIAGFMLVEMDQVSSRDRLVIESEIKASGVEFSGEEDRIEFERSVWREFGYLRPSASQREDILRDAVRLKSSQKRSGFLVSVEQ